MRAAASTLTQVGVHMCRGGDALHLPAAGAGLKVWCAAATAVNSCRSRPRRGHQRELIGRRHLASLPQALRGISRTIGSRSMAHRVSLLGVCCAQRLPSCFVGSVSSSAACPGAGRLCMC